MLKIYFGVCGIGLGHAGRCVPIANKLREEGNEIVLSTYRDAVDYIKREELHVLKAPPVGLAVKPSGEIDFRQTAVNPGIFSLFIFLNQLKSEIQYMKGFKPDLVVSDSRVSSIIAAKLLGIPEVTILNQYRVTIPREKRFLMLAQIADGGILTIIGKVWTLGEYILVPDFPSPYTLSVDNLAIPRSQRSKVKLIGPVLPVRPESIPNKERIKKKLGLDNVRPVIYASISGPVEEKSYFIRKLKKFFKKFPKQYQIVLSLGCPSSLKKPIINNNVIIYDWIPNRFELLKACDLVISRAGLGTLTQSICYGKPLILVPTPSQTEQITNAKRVEKLGIAKVIPQKKLFYNTLLSAVQEVLSENHYKKRVEDIQRKVERYDAVTTATDIITRVVNKKLE